MMSGQSEREAFVLTERDYAILRGIAVHRPQGQRGYIALLQRKLIAAEVVEDEEIDAQIVTLDSLVRYRVGEGTPLEHRLVIGPAKEVLGKTVSLRSLPGLALIGLHASQSIELPQADGDSVTITAEAVLYQPETDRAPRRIPAPRFLN